jgi:hypothetical protein
MAAAEAELTPVLDAPATLPVQWPARSVGCCSPFLTSARLDRHPGLHTCSLAGRLVDVDGGLVVGFGLTELGSAAASGVGWSISRPALLMLKLI